MKVYVVTAGEYSDYHIEAIFTNEEVANQYANLDSDRNVEEYETDIESINPDPDKLVYFVTYDFEADNIKTLCLTAGHSRGDDFVYDYQTVFGFYVSPSETLDNSIRRLGHNSDWLLRIAQDRFYMYCDAHETSRQELIQKKRDHYKRFDEIYPMYTTSVSTEHMLDIAAQNKTNDILHELIAEGNPAPSYGELVWILLQARKEAEEQHEQDELH
jgi:hypothetical protein